MVTNVPVGFESKTDARARCAAVCHFAVDMMEALREYNDQQLLDQVNGKAENNDEVIHLDMRIGINTGPVVAGVVGTSRFLYDVW